MIAVRDQENLVQAHRNAAAAKDLNNGSKGIAGKTPANKPPKTPFKIPLNDENAARTLGKSVVRNNGNGKSFLRTGGKKAEADQNAFVTPAGMPPRKSDINSFVANSSYRVADSCSVGDEDDKCESERLPNPGASQH